MILPKSWMMEAAPRRSPAPWRSQALLALIVLGGVALKLAAWPAPVGHHALDGSNYYQVAAHVAAGDGLQTRLSLYHQGLRSFPQETNLYPLWPLVLGYAARVGDLQTLAVALPTALYALSLVLLHALTNALAGALSRGRRPRVEGPVPSVTVGHAAALLFALNPVFFRHTSLPYAEGLVYGTCFASLLALDRTRSRDGLGWAFVAGGLAGASFLSRPQMLPLLAAVPLALAVTGGSRRALAGAALAALAGATAVAVWTWHLYGFIAPFSPLVLVDYSAYRATPELARFPITLGADSWWGFVVDRFDGLRAAFDPFHANAYARSFGAAVYLVPLAFAAIAIAAPPVRQSWAWIRSSEARTPIGVALTGAGALAAVHVHHGTLIWEWWFHWRHGLPMILPIALALAVLAATGPRWLRGLALLLVAWSVASGAVAVDETSRFLRYATAGPSAEEAALVRWADSRRPPVRMVTTRAQGLAAFSERAGFHWTVCGDDPRQTERLFVFAGATHVLLYPGEEHCPGFRTVLASLRPAASFGRLRVLAAPTVVSRVP